MYFLALFMYYIVNYSAMHVLNQENRRKLACRDFPGLGRIRRLAVTEMQRSGIEVRMASVEGRSRRKLACRDFLGLGRIRRLAVTEMQRSGIEVRMASVRRKLRLHFL